MKTSTDMPEKRNENTVLGREWWRRFGFGASVTWEFNLSNPRKWLLSVEGGMERPYTYFWPRGSVTVFGLNIGAGFCWCYSLDRQARLIAEYKEGKRLC